MSKFSRNDSPMAPECESEKYVKFKKEYRVSQKKKRNMFDRL